MSKKAPIGWDKHHLNKRCYRDAAKVLKKPSTSIKGLGLLKWWYVIINWMSLDGRNLEIFIYLNHTHCPSIQIDSFSKFSKRCNLRQLWAESAPLIGNEVRFQHEWWNNLLFIPDLTIFYHKSRTLNYQIFCFENNNSEVKELC